MERVYNWHITEHCNYACHYCFAQWGKPDEIWKDQSKVESLLHEIHTHGHHPFNDTATQSIRLNFAGGEPTLLGKRLFEINQTARTLGMRTSMITNASLLDRYIDLAGELDMIGISVDALDEETNRLIGRCSSSKKTLSFDQLSTLVRSLRSANPQINVNFNIVVNQYNFDKKIVSQLRTLRPDKIKVFQELSGGLNTSRTTTAMFNTFLEKNSDGHPLFIEDNHAMRESYLMIDPFGRLYQNTNSETYTFSPPICDTGLLQALNSINFNHQKFKDRYHAN